MFHLPMRAAVAWRIGLLGLLSSVGSAQSTAPAASSGARDWPAYRHDAQRSAVTDEPLAFPLPLAWRYTCVQPPAPAWRPVTKALNRLEFDYAPQPVVAGGVVCFGSSSDDTLRALDATTGVETWHFITGGPIRFAPEIAGGKVYCGSDDGHVYCLDAASGKLVWKFRGGLDDERLLGDGRMISRWPIRTGVLVDGGVVYAVAGMWPSEGVFVHALDAATGKPIWCNDTGGRPAPWEVAGAKDLQFYYSGLTPQGNLLAGRDTLVVPMGRAPVALVDRQTGRLTSFQPGKKGTTAGGIPFTIASENFALYGIPSGSARGVGQQVLLGRLVPKMAFRFEPKPVLQPSRGARGLDVALLLTRERFYARRGYGIALAGETLLVGEDGSVAAYETKATPPAKKGDPAIYAPEDQRELWRARVEGQARGLAVAGGRIYVSTDRGELYCFAIAGEKAEGKRQDAGGRSQKTGGRIQNSESETSNSAQSKVQNPKSKIVSLLRQAGMDRGYALVAGDASGEWALALATQTALRTIVALDDPTAAQALRERLLATTALHGSRIQVVDVPRGARLPFAPFFANAVLVAGRGDAVPPAELYRVLRPCGGVLACPGLSAAEGAALRKATGAPAAEWRESDMASLVRGALPGALDWDSTYPADRHLKGPVRPIWFGGPDPMEFYDRSSYHPTMTAAHGRYFYLLDGELVAVDAYNGTELWRRHVPRELRPMTVDGQERLVVLPQGVTELNLAWRQQPPGLQGLTADTGSVYLTVNKTYFRGAGDTCLQMDARTGEQKAVYGTPAEAPIVSLAQPQTWTLGVDETQRGTIVLSADAEGLRVVLTTLDPIVTPDDAWDLGFDFRAPEQRYGLYGKGTFLLRVAPAPAAASAPTWRRLCGERVPAIEVAGETRTNGTAMTVRLPWAALEELTGGRPTGFGFAAVLRSGDGAPIASPVPAETEKTADGKPAVRKLKNPPRAVMALETPLFGDVLIDVLNNGWANVSLAGGADAKVPAPVAGPLASVPDSLRKGRARFDYYRPDAEASRPRTHPLTGDRVTKIYQRGNGCGMVYSSAYLQFMRSGTLGLNDPLDDSGLRVFGGIRISCGLNMLASQGLLVVGDDSSGCVCQYSYQTPVVLANADRRPNEDWAQFFDLPVDNLLRQAALNLGAPGDRRDEGGTLWLGFPRFAGGNAPTLALGRKEFLNGVYPRMTGYGLEVPLTVTATPGLGPYRFNADRTTIRNTDRPWLYASGYRGIERATLTLDFRKPLASRAIAGALTMDGRLDDATWSGRPEAILQFTKTEVFLRHDASYLYVAARRPAIIGENGKPKPWLRAVRKDEAAVWDDDSFELFLGAAKGASVIHLGLSASGARYDAMAGVGEAKETSGWTGPWTGKAQADGQVLTFEFAVPLAMLAEAGLDTGALAINVQMNEQTARSGVLTTGEALCYLGGSGRSRCVNFMPLGLDQTPALAPRSFTVRLHFAEPEADVQPGQRVFDVKLQGQTVLNDFDVMREAGGAHTAVVREFKGVLAGETLTLEFVSSAKEPTAANAPVLCAWEVRDEAFTPPAAVAPGADMVASREVEPEAMEPGDPTAPRADDSHE